ncbi:MAG: NAD kinase [Flavobacteriaceae bacterium]|nr:NAD kinase [Flavobacteriaceae bacterium]
MKVAIYGQYYHENSGDFIKILVEVLMLHKVDVSMEAEYAQILMDNDVIDKSNHKIFSELDSDTDLFFSIGGDGTILSAISFIKDSGIPIVGINTGRLGFLATIKKDEIKQAVESILDKEYTISERTLLQIHPSRQIYELNDFDVALNEVTVSRRNTTSMITVDTYLNDEYLTSYWADGLIISTPTGSTGYSLSCGGPVIVPGSQNFVITPIAPHNLNARPLVISDDTEIRLKISSREERFLTSLDSRIATVESKTEITIKKAPYQIKMIQPKGGSFLKTLRNKLLWGEDKRN